MSKTSDLDRAISNERGEWKEFGPCARCGVDRFDHHQIGGDETRLSLPWSSDWHYAGILLSEMASRCPRFTINTDMENYISFGPTTPFVRFEKLGPEHIAEAWARWKGLVTP